MPEHVEGSNEFYLCQHVNVSCIHGYVIMDHTKDSVLCSLLTLTIQSDAILDPTPRAFRGLGWLGLGWGLECYL